MFERVSEFASSQVGFVGQAAQNGAFPSEGAHYGYYLSRSTNKGEVGDTKEYTQVTVAVISIHTIAFGLVKIDRL